METNDRNKNLAKNTLLLCIGQFGPKLIAMLSLPILTTYLTKSEYGIYDLANSMVSLLVPVMTMQIQQVAFRFLILSKNKSDKTEYFTSAVTYMFVSSLICIPLILIALACFTTYKWLEIFLICLFLISESVYRLVGQLARGIGCNLKYSIAAILFSAFQLLFSVLFIVLIKGGIIGAFFSFSVGYIAAIVYMFVGGRMWEYIKIRSFSKKRLKEMLRLSAPIVPSSVSLWVINLSDRLLITTFLGIEANAIYAVANKIPSLFSMAYTTFNLAWTESAALAVDDQDTEQYYSEMFDKLLCFLTGIMLFLISATPLVFTLLINQQYEQAYMQMPFLFFGVFFNSIVQFFGAIYVAIERTKQVGVSSVAGALLSFLINFLLIRKIGIFAASIAMAVAYLVVCAYRMIDLNKVIKIKYDVKKIAVSLMVFLVAAVFCFQQNVWLNVCNAVIAIVYNVVMNGDMVVRCVKMVIGKIPHRR